VVIKTGKEVKETSQIKKLRGKICGMEMELNILSRDLERFKNELIINNKILTEINENYKFLKEEAKIVSIFAYRDIKRKRDDATRRIKYYKQRIQPLEQAVLRKEIEKEREMDVFEEIYRMQFKNNILEFCSERRKEA